MGHVPSIHFAQHPIVVSKGFQSKQMGRKRTQVAHYIHLALVSCNVVSKVTHN